MSNYQALKGHTSADTAYVVDDYPYGFRLRTQIRYWLETNKNGTRFVSQTLNPKTGAWNKPKASTYVQLGVMVKDLSNGHISWTGWTYYGGEEGLCQFLIDFDGALTDADKDYAAVTLQVYAKIAARKAAGGAGMKTDYRYDPGLAFLERGLCFADMFIADQIANAAPDWSPEFHAAMFHDACRGYLWGSH